MWCLLPSPSPRVIILGPAVAIPVQRVLRSSFGFKSVHPSARRVCQAVLPHHAIFRPAAAAAATPIDRVSIESPHHDCPRVLLFINLFGPGVVASVRCFRPLIIITIIIDYTRAACTRRKPVATVTFYLRFWTRGVLFCFVFSYPVRTHTIQIPPSPPRSF